MSLAGLRTRRPACGRRCSARRVFAAVGVDTRTARPVCPASSIRAMFCTAGTTDGGSRCMFPKALSARPRCRQRACLAGPAGASRAALRQGVEARAGERSEAQEELSVTRATARQISFADVELMRQGVRLEPLLEAISKFLDSQHEMIERVRRDLVRDLKKPRKGRRGLTAPQVLRSLVVMRVKNWDYRELRERIADGVTLRQFTDFYCDPVN